MRATTISALGLPAASSARIWSIVAASQAEKWLPFFCKWMIGGKTPGANRSTRPQTVDFRTRDRCVAAAAQTENAVAGAVAALQRAVESTGAGVAGACRATRRCRRAAIRRNRPPTARWPVAPVAFEPAAPARDDVKGGPLVGHPQPPGRPQFGSREHAAADADRAQDFRDPAAGLEVPPDQVHGAARPAGARGDRQAARRRQARDHPRHLAHRLGREAMPSGAGPAPGARRAVLVPPGGHGGVPAAGRGRRDRAVELPGVHPGGLDRVRARGRQRGRRSSRPS